jgi:hypothetical protein
MRKALAVLLGLFLSLAAGCGPEPSPEPPPEAGASASPPPEGAGSDWHVDRFLRAAADLQAPGKQRACQALRARALAWNL